MVFLSRIYTRSGDTGETGLGDGSRTRKDSMRVVAMGEVDELNAVLGLVQTTRTTESALIGRVQNDLFDLGADLCVPVPTGEAPGTALRVTADQVTFLEREIDRVNADLQPLHSFVLPGGTPSSAWLHFARTVCRRAERAVVHLARDGMINPLIQVYLNRLSDLLFVLARSSNNDGRDDVLWVPGQSRSG